MRIQQGVKFLMSPDEPAGGAPAVVTPEPAVVSEPAANSPDSAVATERAAEALANDKFSAELNASIDKRGTFDQKDVYETPEKKPAERSLADDIKAEIAKQEALTNPPPVEKPAEVTPGIEEKTAPVVEVKAPEVQLVPQTIEINGKQVSFEDAVKMADYYDRMTAEIDKGRQEYEAQKNSPEMVLINYMRDNPAARAKFMELVNAESPEVANQVVQTQELQRLAALEARIAADDRRAQQYTQQQQQLQQREFVANKFVEIDKTMQAYAEKAGLPVSFVEEAGHVAIGLANAGKIPQTFEAIQDAMTKNLDARANYAKTIREQASKGYIAAKQSAPPPPPTAGANPSLQKTHTSFSKELRQSVAADLAHALNDL